MDRPEPKVRVSWLTSWKHSARRGHWPEWYEVGNLVGCLRCVKGGTRVRRLQLQLVTTRA